MGSKHYYNLPLDASLIAWYKADQLLGPNATLPGDGVAVNRWFDCSGNNHHLIAVNAPLFKINVKNSLPAVLFDGVGNQLKCPFTAFNNAVEMTAFLVFKCMWVAGNQFILYTDGGGSGNLRLSINATPVFIGNYNSTGSGPNTGPFVTDTWYLNTIHQSGTSLTISVNGTAAAPMVNTAVPPTAITTLGMGGEGFYFNGHLSEVLLYKRHLGTAGIARVNAYLASKYAITIT